MPIRCLQSIKEISCGNLTHDTQGTTLGLSRSLLIKQNLHHPDVNKANKKETKLAKKRGMEQG